MTFPNRADAGRRLTETLKEYKNTKNTIILALPRGGVMVGYEVAKKLNLPLDIVVPRKIGAPGNPEFAIGAIAESGEMILNEEVFGISEGYLKSEAKKEKLEAARRLKLYRDDRPPLSLENRTVILVDDGLATGLTMRAAISSVKKMKAKKIIVAVPIAPPETVELIKKEVDELIYLDAPPLFGAVGSFYEEFGQTTDDEVIDLLKKSKKFGK